MIRCLLVAGPLLGIMLIPALLPATFGSANAALIEGAAGVSTIAAVTLAISPLFSFCDGFAPRRTWTPRPAAPAVQPETIDFLKS